MEKSKLLKVLLPTVAIALIAVIEFGSGQLTKTNDCTCPGDIVTYNCNVTGSGFTIWRGSAFDCPTVDSMILLRHSEFGSRSGTMGQCNNGAIIGQSLGISTNRLGNTSYMSQLMINLTASPSVISQTIECVHRNPSGMDTLVGSVTLEITDPPPPPTNIQLVGVSPKQLVFNWTTVDSNCSTLQYNVVSNNCGTCPDVKTVTSATCFIDLSAVTDDRMLCSFGISSAICANANISGNLSTPLDVMLKVPPSPIISSAIPHYNTTDNKLIGLDIKFNEVKSVMISNGVDGSALNYTISYTDSNTGDVCYSLTISTSSCMKGICTVPSVSLLPCSKRSGPGDGSIDISISASNRLGRGPSSFTTIGQTNKYFNITLEMTNKITCTHMNQQEGQSTVTCDVVYWPCQRQQQPTTMIAQGTPSTVNIDLPEIPQIHASDYCYAVTASNGTFTVVIEGWIKSSDQDTTLVNESYTSLKTIISTVFPIIFVIVLIVTTILIIHWSYRGKKREFTPPEDNTKVTMSSITTDHRSRILAERYGDTILISIQDKPWQLMQALEVFQEDEIDIVDTKIIGHAEGGYGKISIQCKEPPSDDKMEHIKQHIELLAREEIKTAQLQSTGHQQMTYCQSFPPKCGSLYTFLKQVKHIGSINITDINVRPASTDSTHKDITLTFNCEPGYPENWKEDFDRVFTEYVKQYGTS